MCIHPGRITTLVYGNTLGYEVIRCNTLQEHSCPLLYIARASHAPFATLDTLESESYARCCEQMEFEPLQGVECVGERIRHIDPKAVASAHPRIRQQPSVSTLCIPGDGIRRTGRWVQVDSRDQPPRLVLIEALRYLSSCQLSRCMLVSRAWHQLIRTTPELWSHVWFEARHQRVHEERSRIVPPDVPLRVLMEMLERASTCLHVLDLGILNYISWRSLYWVLLFSYDVEREWYGLRTRRYPQLTLVHLGCPISPEDLLNFGSHLRSVTWRRDNRDASTPLEVISLANIHYHQHIDSEPHVHLQCFWNIP
mmetsp:Transcript_36130/g.69299  ORF Transcript_36130/g.69299 Transcript_36130/m.69299 type:complete len:310 (+) Transcript_36130:38-967(+)